jgi:hypothetical protein
VLKLCDWIHFIYCFVVVVDFLWCLSTSLVTFFPLIVSLPIYSPLRFLLFCCRAPARQRPRRQGRHRDGAGAHGARVDPEQAHGGGDRHGGGRRALPGGHRPRQGPQPPQRLGTYCNCVPVSVSVSVPIFVFVSLFVFVSETATVYRVQPIEQQIIPSLAPYLC